MEINNELMTTMVNNLPKNPCDGCLVLCHRGLVCLCKSQDDCEDIQKYYAILDEYKKAGIYAYIPILKQYKELKAKKKFIVRQLKCINEDIDDLRKEIPDNIIEFLK